MHLELRRRILLAFERAERCDDPVERQEHLTFVVVGGGPTGVEMAGSIAEIAFKTVRHEFRAIDPSTATIILLEGSDRVLRSYPASLSNKATRQLQRLGVDVRLGVTVTGIDERSVTTSDGVIAARTAIWCAGNEASPLAAMLGGPVDRAGRALVETDLSVSEHPRIFAIGDVAHATSAGADVPGVAEGAIQGGAHVARAIRADIAGTTRPTFSYRNKGELATIGRSSAVGTIGRLHLSGWIAWMAWWSVHIFFLIDFRHRMTVMTSWAWSYLTFQRGSRLITVPWHPREEDEDLRPCLPRAPGRRVKTQERTTTKEACHDAARSTRTRRNHRGDRARRATRHSSRRDANAPGPDAPRPDVPRPVA